MQAKLDEQLLIWEQHWRAGTPVSPESLCVDCPELLPALRERIAALLSLDSMLDSSQGSDSTIDSQNDRTFASPPVAGNVRTESYYTLLGHHARGGLGEVLLAKDESLQRNVAVKRMRRPWQDDASRRTRFLREAAITGQLEHPGIVPVHSLGHDPESGPYYSMRFIEGETLQQAIHKLHDALSASQEAIGGSRALRQLLGRFVSVLNTIAFAHSRDVIHRDLKPANVMLGEFGETLVVDWGLAKQLGSEPDVAIDPEATLALDSMVNPSSSTDPNQLTIEGSALGTPAYMSPEQATGQTSRVGKASDIYSLGATLYVLLTGKLPYDSQMQRGVLARIQRGDFPSPRSVRGDVPVALEAITLKAMSRQPEDRYASALEFAADIDNWLADEPVSVCPERWTTRLRRWIKRHPTATSATAGTLVTGVMALVVLLVVTSRSNERLRIANESESQAKSAAITSAELATRNARLAEQQADLALRSLQTVTFDIQRKLRHIPAAHPVRRSLLDTALKGLNEVAASLEKRPAVDRNLLIAHRDLGEVFFEVGAEGGEGASASALTQFQRARDIAERLAAAAPENLDAQRELAICHDRIGEASARVNSTAQAEEHYKQALAIKTRLLAAAPSDAEFERHISVTHNLLGDLALGAGRTEEAGQHYQRALDIREDHRRRQVGLAELDRDLEISYNKTGNVALRLGNSQKALEQYEKALQANQRRASQSAGEYQYERDQSVVLAKLGDLSWTLGNYPQALDYYQQSLAINERQAAADPANFQTRRDVAQSLQNVLDTLRKLGNNEEANRYAQRIVEILEQLAAADPSNRSVLRDLALAYNRLADRLSAEQQHEAAIELHRKSLVIRQQRAAADPSDTRGPSDVAMGMTSLGDGLLAANQHDAALEQYNAALKIHQQRCEANPTDAQIHYNLAAYHQRIGVACRRAGKFDLSQEHYQQALRIGEKLAAADANNMQVQTALIGFHHSLGVLEEARQRFPEARKHYQDGLALARQLVDAGKLTGEDAEWVEYIEAALKKLPPAEGGSRDAGAKD